MISPNDALQVSTETCSFKRMEMGGTRGLTPASMALALLKIAIYSLGGMSSFSDQMDQTK
jgi:hypothetical protein